MAYSLRLDDSSALRFSDDDRSHELHPIWLRERTTEEGSVDGGNLQRLYDPALLPADLTAVSIEEADGHARIVWSDGHEQRVRLLDVAVALGWAPDPRALPSAVPWTTPPDPLPRRPWPGDDDDADLMRALEEFWRHGFVIFTDTPTAPDSLHEMATRLGIVRPTNFGVLFDVVSMSNPSDLAYTPLALEVHTDNPYRMPVPGIQLLHSLHNDADGGESTLVDGMAAAEHLALVHPDGYRALTSVPVTFRYQFGDQAHTNRSPIIETDVDGRFVAIRNNHRHDYVHPVSPDELTRFYGARRRLRELLAEPARTAVFLLEPGELLMMDNRRLLHGRRAYRLETGARHLQGCYMEHDGPELLWRRLSATSGATDIAVL